MNVADLIEELTYRFVVSAADDTQAHFSLVALREWVESQLAVLDDSLTDQHDQVSQAMPSLSASRG